jgi:dolichol-phosphate mannosyltransferase
MVEISVICPIYNEEPNILLLYDRLKKTLNEIHPSHEIIFVNDGSRDNSLKIIKELAAKDKKVKYIDFSRNFGHQIAVFAGLDMSSGNYVGIIDSDLQDPPELFIEMYNKLQEGYYVVYAKRKKRKGESFMKKFTAAMFYRILKAITNTEIPVDTGDFRLVRRKVVEIVTSMPERHKYLRGQIAWVGFPQTYVEFERAERHAGETKYTYGKMIKFALDGITSFSDFPLKIATILGFIFSGVAFLFVIWGLLAKIIKGHEVKGWASLLVSSTFIGGVQLLVLGLFGEYIGRILANTQQRPVYIVNETNIEKKDSVQSKQGVV